jgi:hypothetical protein
MKKILLALAIVIAGATALSINSQQKGMVASATVFTFNGQTWNDTDTHWLGTDWRPVVIDCTGSSGSSASVSLSTRTFTVNASIGTSDAWNGKKVQCQGGNGNCWNGTSCIGNPA